MKYVAPSGPLTVGGVLDNWLRLFRASFAACWPLALITALAGSLLQLAVTPRLPRPGANPLQNMLHVWSAAGAASSIIGNIVVAFIGLVIYGAVLTQQTAVIRGEQPLSFGDALTTGLRQIPSMLLGIVIVVLIVAAFLVPVGIGAALAITRMRHSPLAIAIVMLVVVVAVFAMLYVTVRLQLWMAVMFSENLGGAASVGRSWKLVKGQWWRVTSIGFVSGIVIWILSMAVAAVCGFVVGVMAIHGTGTASPDQVLRRLRLIGVGGQIVQLVNVPLLAAVWLAIYQDVKLRREGGDLAARAEALSGG